MGYSNNTPIYRMNKHLIEVERTKIEVLCSLRYFHYSIAKMINESANTVCNGLNAKISSSMGINSFMKISIHFTVIGSKSMDDTKISYLDQIFEVQNIALLYQ